jgi:hypothetical protein
MFHPAAEPGAGAKTRLTFNTDRTCAAPRLRQSLAALGSGYGLNERGLAALGSGYGLNERGLAALGSGYGLNDKT